MRSILFSLGLLFLLTSSCENDLAEINRVIPAESVGKETFKTVEMLYSDSAIVRVRVLAPLMIRHLDRSSPKQEFTQGVLVEFFSPRKSVISQLTAKYAVRVINEKKVYVRDSVVLQSGLRERLETSELIWDEKAEKIYTNKFVMITTPDEKIWGYGFEANQEFTKWSIKAIEGELKVENLQNEE